MAMMRLPPVRRTLSLARYGVVDGRTTFHGALPGYRAHLYRSGTAALAVAIADACARHGSRNPEVVLPAYCCPDIIAACLFSAVRPRLVDTARGRWGYDPQKLQAALNRDTVAVVAVNLLGAGDDAAAILTTTRVNNTFLIQDSAQYLPPPSDAGWVGDYVVLSFGRGKPLNMLGGGAVAVPHPHQLLCPPLGQGSWRGRLVTAASGTRAAATLFNVITHPKVFWLTSRLPGLGLGETRYQPLESVATVPESIWGRLGAAYEQYSAEEWVLPWIPHLHEWDRLGLEPLRCVAAQQPLGTRRLRLALLANGREQRDELVTALDRNGLGASVMYGVALNRVPDVPPEVANLPDFPNAAALADRLFTLPTHLGVSAVVVARTAACIRAVVSGTRLS